MRLAKHSGATSSLELFLTRFLSLRCNIKSW